MKWLVSCRLSLVSLRQSPLRTLLSVSGVAVGVALVSLMISFGAGAEGAFQQALERMGGNLLTVNPTLTTANALRGGGAPYETLTLDDYRAVARLEGAVRAAPLLVNTSLLKFQDRDLDTTVLGSTPELMEARNLRIVAGRFLDGADVAQRTRVAVVGAYVVDHLFGGEWAIGARILVNGAPYRVIGVMEARGFSPEGADEDNRIIVPVTTAMRRLLNVDSLAGIFVEAASEEDLTPLTQNLSELLKRRHGLDWSDAPEDFVIRDQTRLLKARQETDAGFGRLLNGLTGLALFLGGVGILAVSTLSVRERYGEIGLRMAVGAEPRHILLQFLWESIFISSMGGLLGAAAGIVGVYLGQALADAELALTWQSILYPFVISLVIAVIFGVWPAVGAAKLHPVIALRSH